MRLIARYLQPFLILACAAFSAHADEGDEYRIKGNLFNDYRPPHQRANPGAEWERTKERERSRIDREFEQKRSRSNSGNIDNRDYSRRNHRDDDRMHYHSPDSNRHRNSGTIDNRSYGATPYRVPSVNTAPQWAGSDTPAANTRTRDNTVERKAASKQIEKQREKYYGTRSGEALYPYTTKPVKGSLAADAAPKPDTHRREPATPHAAAGPQDPSYGGNNAWGVPRKNQVDVKRTYQDDIAQYNKEHRQQAWCKDGTISGRGSGACSGHGGLLKPD